MRTPLSVIALAAAVLAGCADGSPAGPDFAEAKPTYTVSGTWDWSEITYINATPFAAQVVIGVEPEGRVTHLTCPASGTMTVTQTGDTFHGSSTQNPSVCTTRGGQTVTAPFPPTLDLVDGEIRGRSVRFSMDTGDFPCHYRGSLRVSGGDTNAWHANGSCDIPPEFGTDEIRDFVAIRP